MKTLYMISRSTAMKLFALQSGILVHNTLKTFQNAGQSNLTMLTGVPRMEELMRASKHMKVISLSFVLRTEILLIGSINQQEQEWKNIKNNKPKDQVKIKEWTDKEDETKKQFMFCKLNKLRDYTRSTFEEKCIMDFLEDSPDVVEKRQDELSEEDSKWYSIYDKLYGTEYQNYDWSTRIKFDKLNIYKYHLSMKRIAKLIQREFADSLCVFSPDDIGIIDVYVDVSDNVDPEIIIEENKRKRKKTRMILI